MNFVWISKITKKRNQLLEIYRNDKHQAQDETSSPQKLQLLAKKEKTPKTVENTGMTTNWNRNHITGHKD